MGTDALAYTLTLSIIPFFVGKITVGIGLKTTLQNCTITSMQDFDYYRDKLTGLSPATISILTDLDIEQKKDVAASILQYENLGLLVEDAFHTYRATEKYRSSTTLHDSDRYLIEHLEKGDFDWENDTKWKQLAMEEAVSEGYVTRVSTPWSKPHRENALPQGKDAAPHKKLYSIKRRLVQIVLGGIWLCWIMNAYPRMEAYQQYLKILVRETGNEMEMLPILYQPEMLFEGLESIAIFLFAMFILLYRPGKRSEIHSDSRKGIIGILVWFCLLTFSTPRMLFFIMRLEAYINPETANIAKQAELIFSQPELTLACAEVLVCFLYTMYLVAYMFAVPCILAIVNRNIKNIKRTDYGNLMAECVYGMKNFIHDYSNLNEADRRQAVLWED